VNEAQRQLLGEARFHQPAAIAEAAARRSTRPSWGGDKLLILAADHPARGVVDVGSDPLAMGNRYDMLDRLLSALSVPGVDGVLGSPDVIEDLLLLGALDDKLAFGSMNRGGLAAAAFEYDDRAEAVDGLASAGKVAMIEPFMSRRIQGKPQSDLSTEAIIRSMSIASALGSTSAYTWLKIPVVENMEPIVEATTLPLVLLGGARDDRTDEMFDRWQRALTLPGVRGLVVGRNLLYPADGDVVGAVKTAASLL